MPDTPHHKRPLDNALEKTVPAEDFSPEALRRALEETDTDDSGSLTPQSFLLRTETDTGGTAIDETTGMGTLGETGDIPPRLLAGDGESGSRFKVVDEVGSGGTSRVYAVQDRSLNRTIALKLLRGRRAAKPGVEKQFVHEARVTAMLEHPNVMPVHDIGTTENGRVYFTMKNITGVSLGDALRAEKSGKALPESMQTLNGKLGVFLKVCDALSFAHDNGFIHQDVKPDNIMLGEYGEVLLLDWGCAITTAEAVDTDTRPAFGTPAYMSPEQARREAVDERSDVYCLGATLYHALTLHHPTWDEEPEAFWEKKRAGEVREFTDTDRRRVPKALRAVLAKSLQTDPTGRYQTVAGFKRDLERFQAGQAVLAYRESPVEAFMRWYRRHSRVFWSSAAAIAIIAGVGTLLFREKLKEMLTWKLVFAEDFSETTTPELPDNWQATAYYNWFDPSADTLGADDATWTIREGALYGAPARNGCHDIGYRHDIHGDLRIEWDATGVFQTDNLNVFIGGASRRNGYTFHFGGFSRPGHVTLTRLVTDAPLTSGRMPIEPQTGVTYHFRMEREGTHIRFFMNGTRIIDYTDIDVLSGIGHQTFGFEVTQNNTVIIDNLRVYHHPLPQKVSPLVAPRQFEDEGLYRKALVRYRSLRRAYPGTDIDAESTFRSARCLHRMDSTDAALEAYRAFEEAFPRHPLVPQSAFQRAEIHARAGRSLQADSVYVFLARRYPSHPVSDAVVASMTDRAVAERNRRERRLGESYEIDRQTLDWCDSAIGAVQHWCGVFDRPTEGNNFLHGCASMLLDYGAGYSIDSVERRLPAQRGPVGGALENHYSVARLQREFPEGRDRIAHALWNLGRYEDVIEQYPDQRSFAARSLLSLGRLREVLERHPEQHSECAVAAAYLGYGREAVLEHRRGDDSTAKALFILGDYQTCIDSFPNTEFGAKAALTLGLGEGYLHLPGLQHERSVMFLVNEMCRPEQAIDTVLRYRNRFARTSFTWRFYETIRTGGMVEQYLSSPHLLLRGRWVNCWLDLGRTEQLMARAPWHDLARFDALMQTGLYDSCLALEPDWTEEVLSVRQRAGRLDELFGQCSQYPRACAIARLSLGEYERVLAEHPEQRRQCAAALNALGRHNEVLRDYPEHRDACFQAAAVLKGDDTAFACYPEFADEYACRLLRTDRVDDLVSKLPYQAGAIAIGRALQHRHDQVVLQSKGFQPGRRDAHEALSIMALHNRVDGQRALAIQRIRARPPLYYRSGDEYLRFSEFLLLPVTSAFLGDTGSLQRAADSIATEFRYHFSQRVHYEAAYLAGRINQDEFMAQPHWDGARNALTLCRALKQDLAGDADAPLQTYRTLLEEPFPTGLMSSFAVRALLQWRVEVLTGGRHG